MKNFGYKNMLFAIILVSFIATCAYATPPRVIKTVPENGDQNVNPRSRRIRIEFDQDMNRGGFSICGGGPKYPKTIGKPKWISKRSIIMQVRLEPNHEYELSINCPSYKSFKNVQGESAEIYPIKFKTGAAGQKSTQSSKTPALLLQEGLYAEETEGDLEKAISLYEQVLEQYRDVERLAAKATYQLGMCYLKKGDKEKAAEYFEEVVSYYPEQTVIVKKAQTQLDKMGVSKYKQGNVFEILGPEICSYIGSKYGEICAEAGAKKLYSNSHIYVVDSEFVLRWGGMGYVYNWTGKPITDRYELSGTSYPDQKLYSISGDEMDIEIVPEKNRSGFYHIYWNPEKPLQPGEFFNYGWATDGSKKLSGIGGGPVYPLTMQNHYGAHAYETFFLAVSEGTIITNQSEEYTNKSNLNGWDIYWWKKEVQQNEGHVVVLSLQKVPRYTQEMHNEIDPNGLIHFTNPNNYTNTGIEPMTSTTFINSDFVNVTGMYYKDGKPVKYTTTHEGNHYRYHITFDKPILPGETIEGTVEGTITGLVKPVIEMPDTYQYYMNHSPNTNVPTLRIETYLLPNGAEVISTSPGMRKTEKDGRIELSVEKIIPAGGSLLTTFRYRLTGAELTSAKPLQLEPAPWVNGEVMELRLKRPAGGEYGTIIYSAQSSTLDGNNTWQIISHMCVTEGSISQYTFVEADAESFIPIYGQTTNWMGNFVAEYNECDVRLTVDTQGKESARDVAVQKIAYDNEQALFLIRRMPLGENYQGSFPIFTVQGGSVIECRIKVLGVEEVAVEAGTFKCYQTDLSIYVGNLRTLQHTLWFSNDEHKYLVKYDVGGTATMELAKVWQKDNNKPLTFENTKPRFSVTIPADWRFYSYGSGPQFSLQLIPPEIKAWAVVVWQKRGDDPDSASAMTITKADCEKLNGFFENYTADEASWCELKINGLEAAQYYATYQDKGNVLRKYTKTKQMVEYRTYIVDESNVYWFVFRVEKDKFEEFKAEFDSIIQSFELTD